MSLLILLLLHSLLLLEQLLLVQLMHVLGLLGDIGVALKLLLPQIIDSTLFLFVLLLPLSLSTQQFHEICSFRLYNRNLRDLFHLWNHCLNTLFV